VEALDLDTCHKFWGPELAAKDSDGDGRTNGEELQDPEGTHCRRIEVAAPEGSGPGTYTVTAIADDDALDAIRYTFRAEPAGGEPIVVYGSFGSSPAVFVLTPGSWRLSVTVTDYCSGLAADATCSTAVEVAIPPPFVRADSNAGGDLDISDGIRTLGVLFRGTGDLPCKRAADANSDGTIDLSDVVFSFDFLFRGGASPKAPSPVCDVADSPLSCAAFPACASRE